MFAAEAEAKAAKRGLWESYVEVKAADERAERGDEMVTLRVSEVQDGSQFYAHTSVDESKVRLVIVAGCTEAWVGCTWGDVLCTGCLALCLCVLLLACG